ncbi:MAG: sulfatase-like hydrolase/transferase [Phycisphaeraceae bacterium]|nr:MAG: sulfatase-like hydrolase/transferase [Phycisphaeraceae bacterium]
MKHRLLTALLALVLAPLLAHAVDRPKNILFIAVDDLKPNLACYGDAHAKTPNIDRLAARGVIFSNAQCQQAVCGPSRASLMTGLRPDTTKVWDLQTLFRDHIPDVVTLPQYLIANGYTTTGMGKIYDPRSVDKQLDRVSWSIPYLETSCVSDETFFYRDPKQVELVLSKLPEAKAKGIKGWKQVQDFIGVRPSTDQADVPDDAYPDGVIADQGVASIRTLAPKDEPFFIAVGFKKPHLPFNAPSRYWDLYDRNEFTPPPPTTGLPTGAPEFAFQDSWELRGGYTDVPGPGIPIPEEDRLRLTHGYYACVSYIDAQVGKLLDALDASGEADNTIVILWGDHGWHLGDHGMYCKHTNYEQATRAPLIIAAPGEGEHGVTHAGPVEFVDIYPTLCDLAGVPIPTDLHGVTLRPAMEDPDHDVKAVAVSQYPRHAEGKGQVMGYSLRDRRYRYIEWRSSGKEVGPGTGEVVAVELYDYETDPDETRNLVDDPAYATVRDRFESYARRAITLGRREVEQNPSDVAADPAHDENVPVAIVETGDLPVPELAERWREPDVLVTYKRTPQGELKLHAFLPETETDEPRPAIVLFHGGGWRSGDPKAFTWQASRLASLGMVVFSAEYRINSTHGTTPFECVADGKSAIRFVRANASTWNIDPARIAAGGGSAGGHVAAAAAILDGFDDPDESPDVSSRPDLLVLWNPVLDTSPDGFGSNQIGDRPEQLSPLHHLSSSTPPTIIFNGTDDKTTSFPTAERFAAEVNSLGGECTLVGYRGEGHSFFHKGKNDGRCYGDSMDRAESFLRQHGFVD